MMIINGNSEPVPIVSQLDLDNRLSDQVLCVIGSNSFYISVDKFATKSRYIRKLCLKLPSVQSIRIAFPPWTSLTEFIALEQHINSSSKLQDLTFSECWKLLMLAEFFQMEELAAECVYTKLLALLDTENCVHLLKDVFEVVSQLDGYKEHWVTLFVKALDYVVTNIGKIPIESLQELDSKQLLPEIRGKIVDKLFKPVALCNVNQESVKNAITPLIGKEDIIVSLDKARKELVAHEKEAQYKKTHKVELVLPVNRKRPLISSVNCEIMSGDSTLQFFVDHLNDKDSTLLRAKVVKLLVNFKEETMYDKYYPFLIKVNPSLDYNKGTSHKIKNGSSSPVIRRTSSNLKKLSSLNLSNNALHKMCMIAYKCEVFSGGLITEQTVTHSNSKPLTICKIPPGTKTAKIVVTEHKLYTILLNYVKSMFYKEDLKGIGMLTYNEIKEIISLSREDKKEGPGSHNLMEWINTHMNDLSNEQIEQLLQTVSTPDKARPKSTLKARTELKRANTYVGETKIHKKSLETFAVRNKGFQQRILKSILESPNVASRFSSERKNTAKKPLNFTACYNMEAGINLMKDTGEARRKSELIRKSSQLLDQLSKIDVPIREFKRSGTVGDKNSPENVLNSTVVVSPIIRSVVVKKRTKSNEGLSPIQRKMSHKRPKKVLRINLGSIADYS